MARLRAAARRPIEANNANNQPSQQSQKEKDKRSHDIVNAAIGAAILKRAMRDPKLNSALIIDKTSVVCYTYRARNGFNGMNVGEAVLTSKGVLKTDEMSGFSSLWNRECAHNSGIDQVDAVSLMMTTIHE